MKAYFGKANELASFRELDHLTLPEKRRALLQAQKSLLWNWRMWAVLFIASAPFVAIGMYFDHGPQKWPFALAWAFIAPGFFGWGYTTLVRNYLEKEFPQSASAQSAPSAPIEKQ
jgi:hypothetical protein